MKSLVDEVKLTIAKYGMLEGGETVLISVSGGPDSLTLLHILNELKPDYDLDLHVFHLNHMMRGRAGQEDADFVKKTAAQLKLPSTIMEADVPAYILANKTSPEDGARQVRYELLGEVAEEIGAERIALGHTADDRVETYLMRVIRGAGLDGLRSIPPMNGDIIRPLIESTRESVMSYCAANNLKPRTDETNEENVFLRNKIRGELIPQLEREFNPAFKEEIAREIMTIEADVDLLEDLTERAWDEAAEITGESVILNRSAFLDQPLAIQRRLLRLAAEELAGEPSPLSFQNTVDIMEKVVTGDSGASLDLPGGLSARREYDTIIIEPLIEVPADDEPDFPATALRVPGVTRLDLLNVAIEAVFTSPELLDKAAGEGVAFLDAGLVKGSGTVRPPHEGDRFTPYGMDGSKKLSDVFVDSKTPRPARRVTPVVEFNGHIVWVAGYRIDEKYKVTRRTKRMLVLRLLKGSS
ncbi:MAG: tRNA lysidine(34) synthetase TilS [Actinomycetota bacterium]